MLDSIFYFYFKHLIHSPKGYVYHFPFNKITVILVKESVLELRANSILVRAMSRVSFNYQIYYYLYNFIIDFISIL